SGEVHDVRTELGDAVQQVARGRGRADIEFDQVSVQRGLDGGSDTLLLSPDAQIAFGGRAEQQHPQLLGLGCTQFPERFADSMFRAVEARFGRRAFGGCAPISRGLLSLALPFRRVGLGALCSCELGLEVCFLLTGSRRPWPATCSLRFRRTRPPCHAARPGSTSISVSPRSW